jgi:enoyl-CoA hydratase/carnithine racemase
MTRSDLQKLHIRKIKFIPKPIMALPNSAPFQFLAIEKEPNNIYVITLRRGEDNKLNSAFCKEIIRAFHGINRELGSQSSGAVITRGNNHKFWSAGIQLNEDDPWSSTDGFYPVCFYVHIPLI